MKELKEAISKAQVLLWESGATGIVIVVCDDVGWESGICGDKAQWLLQLLRLKVPIEGEMKP